MRKKLLVIFANPLGTDPLEFNEEEDGIRDAVDRSKRTLEVAHVRRGATVDDLQFDLRKHSPEIVHFSSHGSKDGLLLQGAGNEIVTLDPAALAEQLAAHVPPLDVVVLSACYSATHADEFRAFGVPWLIAIEQEVDDENAIAFSSAFYGALGDDHGVEFAFREGIRNLKFKNRSDRDLIVLYDNRSEERKKSDSLPAPPPPRVRWRRIRRWLIGVAAPLVVALVALPVTMKECWKGFTGNPTMSFLKPVDDDQALRFTIANGLSEAVTVRNIRMIHRDAGVEKRITIGKLGATSAEAVPAERDDGHVDVGVEHVIWRPAGALAAADAYVRENASSRIHVVADAVTTVSKEKYEMSCDVTLEDIAPFLKERGSACENTEEGCE